MIDEVAQAGWYPDPSGDLTRIRYWDGLAWTEMTYPVAYYQGPFSYQAPYYQDPIPNQAPYYQYPVHHQMSIGYPVQVHHYQATDSTNTTQDNLALVAMICGIAGIVSCVFYVGVLPGLLGIIFGILGLKSRRRSMAVAGIACGSVTMLLFVIYMMFIAISAGLLYGIDSFGPGSIPEIFEGQSY